MGERRLLVRQMNSRVSDKSPEVTRRRVLRVGAASGVVALSAAAVAAPTASAQTEYAVLGSDGTVGGPGGSPLSGSVAIVTQSNTFAASQAVVIPASSNGSALLLQTQSGGSDFAQKVYAGGNAAFIAQTTGASYPAVTKSDVDSSVDHSYQGTQSANAIQNDTIDIWHRSTGDAIFIAHMGGKPPGFQSQSGGDSGLNIMIPLYLDATGDGRSAPSSSIANNRDGMKGVFIQNQVPTNTGAAVHIQNWAAGAAIRIENQVGTVPTGPGRSLQIEEYNGTASSVLLNAYNSLPAGHGWALIDLRAHWANSGSSAPAVAWQVVDSTSTLRAYLTTTGALVLNNNGATSALTVMQAGATALAVGAGGVMIAGAPTQKVGFYNSPPVTQFAPQGTTNGFAAGNGSGVTSSSTYTGGSGASAYTVGDIVLALKKLGLMAP